MSTENQTEPKNHHAVAMGRRGGKVSSPAKAAAAKRNIIAYWQGVRAGGSARVRGGVLKNYTAKFEDGATETVRAVSEKRAIQQSKKIAKERGWIFLGARYENNSNQHQPNPVHTHTTAHTLTDEIRQLVEFKNQGILSAEEFEAAKKKLLG